MRVEREGAGPRARIFGLADGVDARHLRALRRGEVAVDAELDLHGLDARQARHDLGVALREARAEGLRCVLVIHGHGRGSEDGPVLKDRLPKWLATGPLAALVMAFATAPPARGGPGATLVLLRRRRDRR